MTPCAGNYQGSTETRICLQFLPKNTRKPQVMKIKYLKLRYIRLPLKMAFCQANYRTQQSESVILEIQTRNGITAFGEANPLGFVNGESPWSVKADLAFHFLPARLNRLFAIWCAQQALQQINFKSSQIDSLFEKATAFANGDNLAVEIEVYWGHLRQSLSIDSQAALSTLSAAFNTKEDAKTIATQASENLWKTYRNSNLMNGSMSHQITKIKSLISETQVDPAMPTHVCEPVNVGFTSRTLACKFCGRNMPDA